MKQNQTNESQEQTETSKQIKKHRNKIEIMKETQRSATAGNGGKQQSKKLRSRKQESKTANKKQRTATK